MRLPDSPEDRRARNEALQRLGTRVGAVFGAVLVVGLLAHALGVPWWLVAAFGVFVVVVILFEA